MNEYLNDRPELVNPIKSLLRLHWSTFSKLSPEGSTEWLGGCWILFWREAPVEVQLAVHKGAAMAFARAVETELKGRVFMPFREAVRASPEKMKLAEAGLNDPKNRLSRFVVREGFLNLGEMVGYLGASAGAPGISGELRKWLEDKHHELAHQSWSFSKLRDVRNAAAHPSDPFSREQAEKTYVLCQRVLDILLT